MKRTLACGISTACRIRSARAFLQQTARSFSVGLPEGWERIVRRNGDVVYYNSALRKTVRELPGIPRETNAALSPASSTSNGPDDATKTSAEVVNPETQAVPHHEPTENEVIHIDLEPQQCLRAETGAMIYMTDGVEMETTTAGGFQQGMKRIMTGENFFVSRFTYRGDTKGTVALGTSFPSKIVHLRLEDFIGESVICQKGAFLCGSDSVNIEMEFTKNLGAGFFGGEGFVLQRLTGSGDAFVRASGALIERELQTDEVLRISSGCLVAFEPTVHYDITMMKGVKNVVFGGEGLFVTTLTGPGKIFLQSLPFDRVVGEIAARVPGRGGGPVIFPFGGGGGSSGTAAGAVEGGEDGGEAPADEESTSWNSSAETGTDDDIYGGDSRSTDPVDDFGELDAEDSDVGDAAESVVDFFKGFFGRG